MKKLQLILLIIASTFALPAFAQDVTQLELTQQQQAAYQQLQNNASNLSVSWNEQNTAPQWVRMTDLEMDWRSADDIERAYQFLEEYGALYNITDPKQALPVQSQKQDTLGMTHVTLQQVSKGIPVYGVTLNFHFDFSVGSDRLRV